LPAIQHKTEYGNDEDRSWSFLNGKKHQGSHENMQDSNSDDRYDEVICIDTAKELDALVIGDVLVEQEEVAAAEKEELLFQEPPCRSQDGHHVKLKGDASATNTTATEMMPMHQQFQDQVVPLMRRISNIQRSMQQSNAVGLTANNHNTNTNTNDGQSAATTFQTNVLFAVLNCVRSWDQLVRQILPVAVQQPAQQKQQFQQLKDSLPNDGIHDVIASSSSSFANCDSDVVATLVRTATSTALELFGLIQHSVQCGPLKGSKPGYFKRCGGTVAGMVSDYLQAILHWRRPHRCSLCTTDFKQKKRR